METKRNNLKGDPPDGHSSKLTGSTSYDTATDKALDRALRNEPTETKADADAMAGTTPERKRRSLFVNLYKMFVRMLRDAGLNLGVVATMLMISKSVFGMIEKMVPTRESFKKIGSIDIYIFTGLFNWLLDGLEKKRLKAIKDGNRYNRDIYNDKINQAVRRFFDAVSKPLLKYMVRNPYILNLWKEEIERQMNNNEKNT